MYNHSLFIPIRARYVRIHPATPPPFPAPTDATNTTKAINETTDDTESSSTPRCMRIELYGEKAEVCPPQYFLFDGECIRELSGKWTRVEAKEICKKDGWFGEGGLVVPGFELSAFISGLMIR